jgi:CBS domain-containing protein
MKKRTPVSKIMTKDPISVNLSNDVADVVQIFKERNIHHIPVVSGDKLVGMISKTDIDRISYVNSYATEAANTVVYDILKIEQVMTSNLETIQAEDQIKEAAELLARGSYHALPVMEGDKLAGIVTSTDVINYLLEQF